MFVRDDFLPPPAPTITSASNEALRLEPLGPEHNERDHQAWMSSIEHIRSSPGFANRLWPHAMTLAENARDLVAHAEDFAAKRGFTYTILDGDDDVVGCVYIYPDEIHPDEDGGYDAHVRSWVRADRAELDAVIRTAVSEWLRTAWPFTTIRYEGVQP